MRTWIHRLTLLHRFLLLEVGIFLLVFLGILFFVAHYAGQLRGKINHERLLVTRAFAEQVDDWLFGAYHELDVVAHELGDPSRLDDGEHVLALAASFDRGLVVVDEHAQVVLAYPDELRSRDLQLAAHFTVVSRESGRAAWGFQPDPDDQPLVALVVTLPPETQASTGAVGGVLIGLVDAVDSGLGAIPVRAMAVGETGHAEVVSTDGLAVLSTEPDHILRGSDHPAFYLRMLAGGEVDGVEQVAYEDHLEDEPYEDHVMGFVALESVPWGFSLGGSASETYAPIRTLWVAFYGLAGVLGVFALTVTVVGVERLVRPVRNLSYAARRVAGGEVETPIAVTDGGEIGELGESVERMRDSLYRWGKELDRRVSERTATLERRNRELAASSAVAQAVASTLDPVDLLELATTRIEQSLGVEGAIIALRARPGRPADRRLSPGATRLLGDLPDSMCDRCVLADMHADHGSSDPYAPTLDAACLTESIQRAGCSVIRVPIQSSDGTEGVLCVVERDAAMRDGDRRILELLASEVALGLQNAMLYENLRQREADRHALLAKVLSAQEDERRRLARELHDGIAQTLTGATFQLDGILALPEQRWADGRARVEQLRGLNAETLDELRMMILALRPPALDDLGLIAAIERYATRISSSSGVEVVVENRLDRSRLNPDAEVTVFRIVQEALNNVVKHSGASQAVVSLRVEAGMLHVTVEDNGRGFASVRTPRDLTGVGLEGMSERAELLGGTLRVDSSPGLGTTVRLEVAQSLVLDGVPRGIGT